MPEEENQKYRSPEPFLEVKNSETGNGPAALIFIVTIIFLALLAGFLLFYKYRLQSEAADRQQTLNQLITEVNSAENQKIAGKAESIQAAVKILSTAASSKHSFQTFINDLDQKITNDTELTDLAIGSDGTVTMDGLSGSYRSVADLALALQSSSLLQDVSISSLSQTGSGSQAVSFSITAKIKNWSAPSSSSTNSGGANE